MYILFLAEVIHFLIKEGILKAKQKQILYLLIHILLPLAIIKIIFKKGNNLFLFLS